MDRFLPTRTALKHYEITKVLQKRSFALIKSCQNFYQRRNRDLKTPLIHQILCKTLQVSQKVLFFISILNKHYLVYVFISIFRKTKMIYF